MGFLVPWEDVTQGDPGEASQGHQGSSVPLEQGKMMAPAYLSILQQLLACL